MSNMIDAADVMDQKKRITTKKTRKLGKYEVGRTIGEGSFAKVKFARNTDSGENVAIKIMAKSTILKNKMADQVPFFFSHC